MIGIRFSAAAASRAVRAQAEREAASYLRTLELLTGAIVDIAKLRAERGGRMDDRGERFAAKLERAILNQLDGLALSAPQLSPAPRSQSPPPLGA